MRDTVTREHPTENYFLAILRAFRNRTVLLAFSWGEGQITVLKERMIPEGRRSWCALRLHPKLCQLKCFWMETAKNLKPN